MSVTVYGLASGRSLKLEVSHEDREKNLLDFLRSHGVMISSSCNGAGVCKKCVMQNELLICTFTVESYEKEYPNTSIEISYL